MRTRSSDRSPRRLHFEAVEGMLWIALLVGCLATVLLIRGGPPAAVHLLEPQARLWWGWLTVFYLSIAAVLGALATILYAIVRRPGVSRILLQTIAAASLVLALVWNRTALVGLLSGGPEGEHPWSARLLLLFIILGLVGTALGLGSRRPAFLRSVSVVAVGLGFLAFSAGSESGASEDPVLPKASSHSNERLLVIGLDGADWDFLNPLIERGDLPNLAALRETGVWGELQTVRPTRSAPIWTSVVTGVKPQRHGVVNNSVERLRGSYYRLPHRLPVPKRLAVKQLVSYMRDRGIIAPSTVASFDRRVPAFWNIATANDSPVDFINWWASWPVEQIRGHIVSDRVHFWRSEAKGYAVDRGFVTFPNSLLVGLSPLIIHPDDVTREHALQFMEVSVEEFEEMKTTPYRHHRLKSEFKYLYSMFASNVQMSLHLMELGRQEIGRPSDQFVLLRIIDQASHQALEYSELVENHLKSKPEEIEKYSRVVTEVYRAADRAVGEMVEAFGDGNIVILSDHGFKLLRPRSRYATYGHFGASTPDGILIASGPAFRTGLIEGLGIYDMMPLFMALKGWPVAEDFVRGVPSGIFSESFLQANPIEQVATYGTMSVSLPEEGPIVADEEMVERLRALGYLE